MESETRVFKRKIYESMFKWKRERDGKTALLIKGSSGYKTHKSLDEFCKKFSERISNRYLIWKECER